MKKVVLAALAAVVVAAAVSALPLSVTWTEGKVEKMKGSAWVAIGAGDSIDSSETVRLGPDSYAEFADGRRKIVLSAPGTFSLDALVKAGADQTKKRSGTVDKLSKLVDPKAQSGQTAVGGVRGAEAGADTMTWVSEDDEETVSALDAARALAREGRYGEAANRFAEAVSFSEGESKDAALYGQAWALAADGSTLKALKLLRSMPAIGVWAGPRALLLARLDLESGAKAEAKSVLEAAIAAGFLAGEELQLAKGMLEEAK